MGGQVVCKHTKANGDDSNGSTLDQSVFKIVKRCDPPTPDAKANEDLMSLVISYPHSQQS